MESILRCREVSKDRGHSVYCDRLGRWVSSRYCYICLFWVGEVKQDAEKG